jgi:Domain of unknown function (DUF1990)
MKGEQAPGRVGTVARWPLGLAIVGWRYMWRTIPVHRSEEPGTLADLPPGWDDTAGGAGQQMLADGSGPLLHRTYSVRIAGSPVGPAELIGLVESRLNWAAPEMAVFRWTRGRPGSLRPGDELIVRMPGPWDGPVRVSDRAAASFRFVTLNGHLEAGQIEFRAVADEGLLRFEIESWARAGDRLADLLYNRLRLAKEIQLNMWSHVCLRAAVLAEGRPRGGITIATRSLPWPPPPPDYPRNSHD